MRTFAIGLVVLVVGLLALPVLAQDAGENVIRNPGFEELDGVAVKDWSATGTGWGNAMLATSDAARTGDVGVKIHNRAGWIYQTVPVEAGATYELSTWLRGEGTAALKLEYVCVEDGRHRTCHELPKNGISISGDEWRQETLRSVVPEGPVSVRIMLRLTSGEGTYVHYDDAVFRKVD